MNTDFLIYLVVLNTTSIVVLSVVMVGLYRTMKSLVIVEKLARKIHKDRIEGKSGQQVGGER